MTDWTPIVVAVVSGLLLLPPAVLGLIAARGVPRRLTELKALNEVLENPPEDDAGYEALAQRRTALATAHGERSAHIDPAVVVASPLVIGWLLTSVGVFISGSRGKPLGQVLDLSVAWLGNASIVVGFCAMLVGLFFAGVWVVAIVVRTWRGLSRENERPRRTKRGQ